MSRAITAEEYNAAVARAPGDCPLFAAGDLRSGRQVRWRARGGGRVATGGRAGGRAGGWLAEWVAERGG